MRRNKRKKLFKVDLTCAQCGKLFKMHVGCSACSAVTRISCMGRPAPACIASSVFCKRECKSLFRHNIAIAARARRLSPELAAFEDGMHVLLRLFHRLKFHNELELAIALEPIVELGVEFGSLMQRRLQKI